MNLHSASFLSLLMIALAAGCASRERTNSGSEAWTIIERTAPSDPVAAEMIITLASTQQSYDIAGHPDGRSISVSMEPTNRFGAAWARRDGDRRTEFLREGANGNIEMTAAIDHADSAISLFNPPLIIAYAELPPGEMRVQEADIGVVDEHRPQKQKERGHITQSIEYVGDALIRTTAGDFRVRQVVVRFHADLRMADADTTTTLFIDPHRGVIVRLRDESIVILGVPSRSTHETLLLRVADRSSDRAR